MGEWTVVGRTHGTWEKLSRETRAGLPLEAFPDDPNDQGPHQTPRFSSLPMGILLQRLWEGPGNPYF